MIKGILVNLIFAGTAVLPIAVRAEPQPDENSHDAHCYAAFEAQDHQGVIQWCKLAAEDHSIDASETTGHEHYRNLFLEGMDLQNLGVTYGLLKDDVIARTYAQTAYNIAQLIIAVSSDQDIVEQARRLAEKAKEILEMTPNQSPFKGALA